MLKIFKAEENAEPVEIGIADKVRFKWEGGGRPVAGGGLYELREDVVKNGFHIYGLKTPVPFTARPTGFLLSTGAGVVSQQQYDNMLLALTCIVKMMGGAVTISPNEFELAHRTLQIEAYDQKNPDLLILNTKEKA